MSWSKYDQAMTDVDILFAGVPVSAIDGASSWYSQLFGRAPDVVVADDEVMWRFTDSAWFYIVVDEARGGFALVTLCVADLDRTLSEIAERGIQFGPVEQVGDEGRKATVSDAEGNTINLIEVRSKP